MAEVATVGGALVTAASDCSDGVALSAAQRARAERQRQRARALRDARLVAVPQSNGMATRLEGVERLFDSGGGFLLEAAEGGAAEVDTAASAKCPPAPEIDPTRQPRCEQCGTRFPHSYLYDTFQMNVCDDCRDPEGEHALMTRTEAKAEFLLKDCDLDAREPPLPALRRRNPHRGGHDMRLYVRAQLRRRALLVWGGEAELEEERERRSAAASTRAAGAARKRVQALRRALRPAARAAADAAHAHEFGDERALGDDQYERTCNVCGLVQTYEKM